MQHLNLFSKVTRAALICASLLLLTLATACKKDDNNSSNSGGNNSGGNNNNNDDPPSLTDYKNSNHAIFVGFLVGDGNDPADGYNPANAPDSLDYLEFFAGRDADESHWRAAQAKGTKIVVCHFIADAYYDGAANDPNAGDNDYNPNGNRSYNHWAKNMYNQHIVQDKLDGIDLDIESGTFGGGVGHNAANGDSLVTAVARYFGPNSTAGLTAAGKKPTFFYDTDGSGGFEQQMCINHKSDFDYILFQSYTTGNHYWNGTGVNSLASLVNYYGKEKLIFLVNGDSFVHPDGSQDQAGGDAKASQDLLDYAHWVKDNNGAGVGAYRMSRDYNHTPHFSISRQAIQIMNPAQ